jgi:YesN/AraC family two-component response regulator
MKIPQIPQYGILVETHSHGPGFSTTLHSHAYHSFVYIISGKGTCVMAGHKHKLEANTAILLKKKQLHQFFDSPKNPMTVFVVYFNDRVTSHISEIIKPLLTHSRPLTPNPFQIRNIRALLRQMLYEQASRPKYFTKSIEQCFWAIMVGLARVDIEPSDEQQDSARRVSQVLDYFEQHYYEPMELPEAAKMADLSQRQFRSIVHRLKKCNFVQFINTVRIQKASHLLRTTAMPVTAIAFEVGFEDLSTFYRQFKKSFGVAPLRYKEINFEI